VRGWQRRAWGRGCCQGSGSAPPTGFPCAALLPFCTPNTAHAVTWKAATSTCSSPGHSPALALMQERSGRISRRAGRGGGGLRNEGQERHRTLSCGTCTSSSRNRSTSTVDGGGALTACPAHHWTACSKAQRPGLPKEFGSLESRSTPCAAEPSTSVKSIKGD